MLKVWEILHLANIDSGDREKTPSFGVPWASPYIIGMAKLKGAVKTLLHLDGVLTSAAI